jgi:hypothetical protein
LSRRVRRGDWGGEGVGEEEAWEDVVWESEVKTSEIVWVVRKFVVLWALIHISF